MSTDDCKKKLVELYPETQEKFWKRTSKHKNSQNLWERVFTYSDGRTATLQERGDELFEIKQALETLPSGMIVIHPDMSMERHLFGTNQAEFLTALFVTPNHSEIEFLKVLEFSTNWDNPDKLRSSYDFAGNIDFKEFTKRCTEQNINLVESYQHYIAYQVEHLYSLDEDSWGDIAASDYDDSMADLLYVLKKIQTGYLDNGINAPLNASLNVKIISVAKEFSSTMKEYFDEDAEDSVNFIKSFIKNFK